METPALDHIDRRMLTLLQRNNRRTLRALADELSISAPTCRMQRCPEVIQCAELSGDVDYLLTVVARDLPAFGDFTRRHLADDRRIRTYRSLLVLRLPKNGHQLPTD